jgi:hypothetical protein
MKMSAAAWLGLAQIALIAITEILLSIAQAFQVFKLKLSQIFSFRGAKLNERSTYPANLVEICREMVGCEFFWSTRHCPGEVPSQ